MKSWKKKREFTLIIIFVILPQNDILSSKIKVLKFLGIQARYWILVWKPLSNNLNKTDRVFLEAFLERVEHFLFFQLLITKYSLLVGLLYPNWHKQLFSFDFLKNKHTFWYDVICKNPKNFRRLPAYDFAHAEVKKSNFCPKILEFLDDIGIILNDFQSLFYSAIKIWVKLTWAENRKNPEIQPIDIKSGNHDE